MKRRGFVRTSALAGLGIGLSGISACTSAGKDQYESSEDDSKSKISLEPFFKLSLAQWSIHNMIREEGLSPFEFASLAHKWGFEGLEYVSQLYMTSKECVGGWPGFDAKVKEMVEESNKRSADLGIQNLVMMVDMERGRGDMSVVDGAMRRKAVEAHYPWVDATAAMGCSTMRINLYGDFSDELGWKESSIEAMSMLGEYAAKQNVNIAAENHDYLTSKSSLLMEVIGKVDMVNCGTLADFGNFCVRTSEGSRGGDCVEEYDRYKGVEEMMAKSFGVSAKSKDFDESGNETSTDFKRMLQIVKDSGYNGFISVEYEGSELGEEEGIKATKELLLRTAKELT